ncbi:hypothetical protein EFA46_009005 [Halarchaeum sp. CBA1220]|uniref:hypothetical protein n=1 Tax=Halarchaeum sp. CBA1220 TaxID=1853682 RepID=UPI000F6ABFDB|nr:hypothetical protein [Halarchaeum sp. CBA1220]QLC34338.1 hypothetical protein EFA46_009005 [Halarchaeum sp. CBA1220]
MGGDLTSFLDSTRISRRDALFGVGGTAAGVLGASALRWWPTPNNPGLEIEVTHLEQEVTRAQETIHTEVTYRNTGDTERKLLTGYAIQAPFGFYYIRPYDWIATRVAPDDELTRTFTWSPSDVAMAGQYTGIGIANLFAQDALTRNPTQNTQAFVDAYGAEPFTVTRADTLVPIDRDPRPHSVASSMDAAFDVPNVGNVLGAVASMFGPTLHGIFEGLRHGIEQIISDITSLLSNPWGYLTSIYDALMMLRKHLWAITDLVQAYLRSFAQNMREDNPYQKSENPDQYTAFNVGWVSGLGLFKILKTYLSGSSSTLQSVLRRSSKFRKVVDGIKSSLNVAGGAALLSSRLTPDVVQEVIDQLDWIDLDEMTPEKLNEALRKIDTGEGVTDDGVEAAGEISTGAKLLRKAKNKELTDAGDFGEGLHIGRIADKDSIIRDLNDDTLDSPGTYYLHSVDIKDSDGEFDWVKLSVKEMDDNSPSRVTVDRIGEVKTGKNAPARKTANELQNSLRKARSDGVTVEGLDSSHFSDHVDMQVVGPTDEALGYVRLDGVDSVGVADLGYHSRTFTTLETVDQSLQKRGKRLFEELAEAGKDTDTGVSVALQRPSGV